MYPSKAYALLQRFVTAAIERLDFSGFALMASVARTLKN
jgi:hypothetical protein